MSIRVLFSIKKIEKSVREFLELKALDLDTTPKKSFGTTQTDNNMGFELIKSQSIF